MRKLVRRLTAALLGLLLALAPLLPLPMLSPVFPFLSPLLASSACAEAAPEVVTVDESNVSDAPIALLEPVPTKAPAALASLAALPAENTAAQTDEEGFALSGEYVCEDEANGEYFYRSPTLQVHIVRHTDSGPSVVWHEADIRTRGDTLFHVWPYDETDTVAKTAKQTVVAQKNHLVFAVNGDFSHLRRSWNARVGILIRNGEVISDRTFTASATRYPNLDNMAFLTDGRMLAFGRNEHTAEEYLAMGAYDVLSFGPVLIQGGVINSEAFHRYGWERAPRTAIGMVEPGHYVALMAEGRHDGSKGWSTTHLAEHMAALGCTEALNLDGGQSASMIFMGRQIIRVGMSESENASARKASEVVGVGVSRLVQPEE